MNSFKTKLFVSTILSLCLVFTAASEEEFVDEIPWVHLDIAGPARARSSSALNPEGGTGFGVIGLMNFFKSVSKNPQ